MLGRSNRFQLFRLRTSNRMTNKDFYYNKAKQEGFRSRAAYKLQQLDEKEDLIERGDAVLDLGAAPGGWMQIASEAVGAEGVVIGVDFQRIKPIEEYPARDVAIKGDVAEADTIAAVRDSLPTGKADVVVSDMAPNMTGDYGLDQARSMHLANQAFEIAQSLLAPGGNFVVKVFQGEDVTDFLHQLQNTFEYVRTTSPKASRDSSSEIYLIAKGFVDPPVDAGARQTVDIVDTGDEGDGIATIDGYTIFVPDTAIGESVEIEVVDVKARYGFARRIE